MLTALAQHWVSLSKLSIMMGRLTENIVVFILTILRYKLNICWYNLGLHLTSGANDTRGCWWTENLTLVLEKLFREDWRLDLGCGCDGSITSRRLSWRAPWASARRGWQYHSHTLSQLIRSIEAIRSEFTGVRKQDRCKWVYGWRRNSSGSSSVVGKEGLSANRIQGLQLDAIKTHKWHIIRCSAITGANLQEGLAWVVQDAKARLFLYWVIQVVGGTDLPLCNEFAAYSCCSLVGVKVRQGNRVFHTRNSCSTINI